MASRKTRCMASASVSARIDVDAGRAVGRRRRHERPGGSRGGPPPRAVAWCGRPGAARRRGRSRRTRRGRPGAATPKRDEARARAMAEVGGWLGHADATGGDGEDVGVAEPHAQRAARARRARRRAGRRRCPAAERRGWAMSLARRPAPGSPRAAAGCPPWPGRPPSPGIPGRRSARKRAPASGTSTRPPSVISKRPSSPDAPKRCFTVRTGGGRGGGRPRRRGRCRRRARAPAARPGRRPW